MPDKFSIDSHKIHHHIDRLHQWAYGDKSKVYPIYVEVSPVGHCNHRCTFCAVDYIGYKTRALDPQVLTARLQEMAQCGVKSVMFAGEGEPLLHPQMAAITVGAHNSGLDCAFTTNGVALTRKFCGEALDSIKWIKVSCNAGDEETYEKIHKAHKGDWKKVWDNLQYACQSNTKATIGVQALVLPDNIDSLESLIQRARDTGVAYVVLKPYSQHNHSTTRAYARVKYEGTREFLRGLAEKYTDEKFEVISRERAMEVWDTPGHSYEKCLSTPYFWAYIMATGDVYGCSAYLMDDRFNYGNINAHTFREIWEGDKRKASMDYVANQLDISECRKNCRMEHVNRYLWDVANPNEHKNFI